MTFNTSIVVAAGCVLSYPLGISGAGTDALVADRNHLAALVESLSGPVAIPMAAWLVLGCVVGIGASFLVRSLRCSRGLVGGALGGLIAAGVFYLEVQQLGEMGAHLLAAALLTLSTLLIILRARLGAGAAGPNATKAKKQAAASAAPTAKDQSASVPDPAPKPPSKTQSSPTHDPEPAPADDPVSEPEPQVQATAQGNSAPDDEAQAEPEDKSHKTPKDNSHAAPANKPSAPAPKTKASPIATKKQPTPLSHQKAKPKAGKPGSGSSWMQDHV
ncbi:MAG: hypothetical protein V3T28_08050 [Gemmatimonadales bacterium]